MNILNPSKFSRDELSSIELQPFSEQLKPIIKETLIETEKTKRNRKGTIFTPMFTVFVVLGIAMRHDLSYSKVVNWIISTVRWLSLSLPQKIFKEGTVTKARQYLGVEVFSRIFEKFNQQHYVLDPDFYGRNTVIFDGVAATIPDTPSNNNRFGKPSNDKGSAAFPQIRIVALLSLPLRCILDVAYGPFIGKGNGERALMAQILYQFRDKSLLFLLDAGFYSFELIEHFKITHQNFVMKLDSTVKVKYIKYFRG